MAWGVDATIRWRHNIFVLRCGDVANPVLGMKQGVTYTFDQSDASNWYHPLGFAYNPDGAHKGVDELEPGLLEDWACAKGMQCQAPMYFINDEYVGTYSNIDNSDVTTLRPCFPSTPSTRRGPLLDDVEATLGLRRWRSRRCTAAGKASRSRRARTISVWTSTSPRSSFAARTGWRTSTRSR